MNKPYRAQTATKEAQLTMAVWPWSERVAHWPLSLSLMWSTARNSAVAELLVLGATTTSGPHPLLLPWPGHPSYGLLASLAVTMLKVMIIMLSQFGYVFVDEVCLYFLFYCIFYVLFIISLVKMMFVRHTFMFFDCMEITSPPISRKLVGEPMTIHCILILSWKSSC